MIEPLTVGSAAHAAIEEVIYSGVDLKQPTYVGRHGKVIHKEVMEIMTRNLVNAQDIYPPADAGDVGHLKIQWNPRSRKEVAAAEQVFKAAKKAGVVFILLADDAEFEGRKFTKFSEVTAALKEAKAKRVPVRPVGVSRVAGG